MWIFEYLGFLVFQLAIGNYLVTGPGFRGYAKNESEAMKIIDGFIAVQCTE